MKATKLRLQDFRIYEDVEIVFDQPLSIIRGGGHSGKTTIGRAFKLALSKCAEGTDPRGAGANDSIRVNGKKAVIEATIEGHLGDVDLRVSYGPNAQGRQQSLKSETDGLDVAFLRFMDSNQERLSCCLDSEYFLSPKTDQKAILAALVLPSEYEFEESIRNSVEKYLGKMDWTRPPVQIIDEIYGGNNKGVYGARTQAKANLAGIHVPQKPVPSDLTSAAIQEKLFELRKKAATEAGKLNRGNTREVGRLEQKLLEAERKLQQATSQRDHSALSLEAYVKQVLSVAMVKKYEKIAANSAKAKELMDKTEVNSRKIEEAIEAQGSYRDMLLEPICFTCTQPISKEFVDGKIAEFETIVDKLSEIQQTQMRELQELGDILGAETALKQSAEAKGKVEHLRNELAQLDEAINQTEAQIASDRKALDQLKEQEAAPQDTSALDEVNGVIATWEAKLGPAVQYESQVKQYDRAISDRAQYQENVTELESLCTLFGKDGIKKDLISEHVGNFEAIVNKTLSAWGYEARLDIDNGVFYVMTPEGELPAKELSGSEKMFFKISLQAAIAHESGIRMIIVDPLDQIDETDRGRLFACIDGMLKADALDQAILIGHDLRRDTVEHDGVAVYFVENGQVERL